MAIRVQHRAHWPLGQVVYGEGLRQSAAHPHRKEFSPVRAVEKLCAQGPSTILAQYLEGGVLDLVGELFGSNGLEIREPDTREGFVKVASDVRSRDARRTHDVRRSLTLLPTCRT